MRSSINVCLYLFLVLITRSKADDKTTTDIRSSNWNTETLKDAVDIITSSPLADVQTNISSNVIQVPQNVSRPLRKNDRFRSGKIIFRDDAFRWSPLGDPDSTSSRTRTRRNNKTWRTKSGSKEFPRKVKRKSASSGRLSNREYADDSQMFGVFDSLPLMNLNSGFGQKSREPLRAQNPGPPYLDGYSSPYEESDTLLLVSNDNPEGFQNSHIANRGAPLPVESREFVPNSGIPVSGKGTRRPQLDHDVTPEGKDYPDYSLSSIYGGPHYPQYGPAVSPPDYADQLPHPHGYNGGGGGGGVGKILTVTHTQYKEVPVTQYVTDTRTDYITHYKTHLKTKVHEIPVTEYSTRVIPKEVPVYTTLYKTVYHTEYHTTTTIRHNTVHYTSTKHRTKVLTSYVTSISHLTQTSLLHTTVYEPVYLTTTFHRSIYLTATETKNYHHTSTTYEPVYVTTTSVHKLYVTETVVTPQYITTTLYEKVYSTLTVPLYVTTTEQIRDTVPFYLTTTHTKEHYLTTTNAVPYYVTTTVLAPSPPQYFTTTVLKPAYRSSPVESHPLARGAL